MTRYPSSRCSRRWVRNLALHRRPSRVPRHSFRRRVTNDCLLHLPSPLLPHSYLPHPHLLLEVRLMAWKFSVEGSDSFDNDGEKVAFERHLVGEVRAFVERFAV